MMLIGTTLDTYCLPALLGPTHVAAACQGFSPRAIFPAHRALATFWQPLIPLCAIAPLAMFWCSSTLNPRP